jgi:dienelactone hydrolase
MRLGRLLAGLACLTACAPFHDPPPPIPVNPSTDVREVSLAGGFITARLEIPRIPAGPKPAVISPATERDALLAAGAVIVTYRVNWGLLKGFAPPPPPQPPPADAAPPATEPTPPKTYGAWLLAAPTPKTVGKGYFDLIGYNANSAVPAVVDHLVTVPEIDPKRIGIGGRSTGGITALQAVAAEPRIAAAAVTVACGDYRCFLHRSTLGMKGEPLDLDPAYAASLDERDPIHHPERLVHARLLMVNGADDAAVPLPCANATARALERAYARARTPERFRFVVLGEQGHNLDTRADEEVMAWWWRWLLHPGDSSADAAGSDARPGATPARRRRQ